MTGRVEKAKAAFTKIYDKDIWRLEKQQPRPDLIQHFARLIENTIKQYNIRSVVEFGCGFWSYSRLVDWSSVTYNGYDVAAGVIEYNRNTYGAPNIRFHQMADDTQLAEGDLLICRDVLQHLPTEDVLHYIGIFKDLFPYMLIVNDILPDNNVNGQIEYGGHRALRLDIAPFNEVCDVLDEWDNPGISVVYRKQACLLKGTRQP